MFSHKITIISRSLTEKAQYIKKMNLGGVMLWSIETDDFNGICGEKYPLLKTLNSVLRNGPPVSPPLLSSTTEESSLPGLTSEVPWNNTDQPEKPPHPSQICYQAGYVQDPVDCKVFYYCNPIGGSFEISKFQCPSGTSFDVTISGCNHENLVQC